MNYIYQMFNRFTIIFLVSSCCMFVSCEKTEEISDLQSEQFLKYFGTSGTDYAADIHSLSDGYLLLGSARQIDAFLYKTDQYGNVEWEQQITEEQTVTVSAFHKLSDGRFIVCGNVTNKFGYTDVIVIMLSASYNVEWTRNYGARYDESASDITEDAQGNLFVTGTISTDENKNDDSKDIMIMMLSNTGDSLWTENIGGSKADVGNAIAVSDDDLIHVVGSTTSYNDAGQDKSNIILLTVKKNKAVLRRSTFGAMGNDYGTGVVLDDDGSVYCSGAVENEQGDTDAWIAKVAPSSIEPTWEKTKGTGRHDFALSIAKDGNSLLIGGYSGDIQNGDKNTYVVEYSTDGNALNEFAPLGGGDEYVQSVTFANDGSPVFIGIADFESNALMFIQKTTF